jgi:hypothetical protein
VFCLESNDTLGAEAAFARADERGSGGAAHFLGMLLADRGDLAGAQAAQRRASERGYVAAAG